MKRWITLALILISVCLVTGCEIQQNGSIDSLSGESEMEEKELTTALLQLYIDGTPVTVQWEDNQTVKELRTLAENETIQVQTSAYGGFEQVGPLPQSFSRNDVQMATEAGDIVLYAGNQIVLFFGANSWSYTKLGHVVELTESELTDLLDHDFVTIEIAIG